MLWLKSKFHLRSSRSGCGQNIGSFFSAAGVGAEWYSRFESVSLELKLRNKKPRQTLDWVRRKTF